MSAFPSLAGLLVPAGDSNGGQAVGGPAADPKELEDIEKLANDYFQVPTVGCESCGACALRGQAGLGTNF